MRFVETGADIPDELIHEALDGSVVFLCGAGVSRTVKMPSFEGLTKQVYKRMRERYQEEPAEHTAFKRKEFDRVLRSLEKRTNTPRTESLVRKLTADILKAPKNVNAPNHLALLQVSRDREGRSKILTTNFDTLFEHAARAAGLDVPSHAGKAIPRPGDRRDHGILHLHGRISDERLDLEESDLVLTSADFGDAYLRDGWASQYIEDRMRRNTLVLVGYAAEDTALRLLLETLDADRYRFRDLKNIYAMDRKTDVSASVWKSKGIKPIEFRDYVDIYDTLQEWAKYSINPATYGRRRLAAILNLS